MPPWHLLPLRNEPRSRPGPPPIISACCSIRHELHHSLWPCLLHVFFFFLFSGPKESLILGCAGPESRGETSPSQSHGIDRKMTHWPPDLRFNCEQRSFPLGAVQFRRSSFFPIGEWTRKNLTLVMNTPTHTYGEGPSSISFPPISFAIIAATAATAATAVEGHLFRIGLLLIAMEKKKKMERKRYWREEKEEQEEEQQ